MAASNPVSANPLFTPFQFVSPNASPFEPARRIERVIGERGRRLVLGLNLETDLASITASLVVVEGNGKFLTVIRAISDRESLPSQVTQILQRLRSCREPSLGDLKAVQADIAAVQNGLVDQLKRQAGKYVDRLLVIAVSDPGLLVPSGTSEYSYCPICDPSLLAAVSGNSVIDAFPIRDQIAGGSGLGLESLPAWLLCADRSRPLADETRLLIILRDQLTAYYLPPSDGLDDELPDVRITSLTGMSYFEPMRGCLADDFEEELSRLNLNGRLNKELAAAIFEHQGKLELEPWIKRIGLADVVRTTFVSMLDFVVRAFDPRSDNGFRPIGEVIIDCHPGILGTMFNQALRVFDTHQIRRREIELGQPGCILAVLTAILGMLSIDQMPANLPAITGAHGQKILGRITPGSPCNWRQLLREMSDYHPPAMRLRDAV